MHFEYVLCIESAIEDCPHLSRWSQLFIYYINNEKKNIFYIFNTQNSMNMFLYYSNFSTKLKNGFFYSLRQLTHGKITALMISAWNLTNKTMKTLLYTSVLEEWHWDVKVQLMDMSTQSYTCQQSNTFLYKISMKIERMLLRKLPRRRSRRKENPGQESIHSSVHSHQKSNQNDEDPRNIRSYTFFEEITIQEHCNIHHSARFTNYEQWKVKHSSIHNKDGKIYTLDLLWKALAINWLLSTWRLANTE